MLFRSGVIVGLPESPIENVLLENVEISAPTGRIINVSVIANATFGIAWPKS